MGERGTVESHRKRQGQRWSSCESERETRRESSHKMFIFKKEKENRVKQGDGRGQEVGEENI